MRSGIGAIISSELHPGFVFSAVTIPFILPSLLSVIFCCFLSHCALPSLSHMYHVCLYLWLFLFSTSQGGSHTQPQYHRQTEAVTNSWIHPMNTVCLRAQSWLVIVCIISMLMHRTQILCMWDEWHRHTFCFAIDCSSVSFQNCFWDYPCVGTRRCVFIQTMLYIYYLCRDPAFLFISIKLQSLTNTSHICICLKKEKSSWICPFLHRKLTGLFWAKTHPLYKFVGNMFSSLCNPSDKPINSPTNLMTDVVKNLGKVAP